MVLSLVDLSLCSIMDGIINGTIRHPHLLPPNLRERILDTAFKQGLPYHPNGLELLTSVEFLNGMTSISAKACNNNNMEFLQRLIESLATKLPDGKTFGAGIKNLNLKVYDYGVDGSNFENEKTWSDVISKVFDLIAQCPNLVSLDLHMDKSRAKEGYWPLNENENIAYNRVMENLINLSVMLYELADIIDGERSIINFKQLTTLKLVNCYFDNGDWPKLLEKIPFLENLHLFDVIANSNVLDWIVPSPLPHLKSLEVLGNRYTRIFKCNKAFVDKLMECPQLRQVHLILNQKSTDEESLVRLASMNIDLKMDVRIVVHRGPDVTEIALILDSSSKFKLVRIFHEKIESFELDVWLEWNEQLSTALEDVVNTCSNLTSFDIEQPRFRVNQAQVECSEEQKRFFAALVRFFGNPERALMLQSLRLDGNLDETVMSAVFENCLNLVRLEIWNCSSIRDQHLIDWVARGGGKLTDLVVVRCDNVTIEGIIPILAKSAERLLCYYCPGLGQDGGGRDWKAVLRNRCPNAL